jgi:hypothetical protein
MALRLRKPSKEGADMRRKMLAGILAAAALSITAAPAFGPGNSDKGPHDAGAKCHPPGQTAGDPGCR